jgi:hypothetical protein
MIIETQPILNGIMLNVNVKHSCGHSIKYSFKTEYEAIYNSKELCNKPCPNCNQREKHEHD